MLVVSSGLLNGQMFIVLAFSNLRRSRFLSLMKLEAGDGMMAWRHSKAEPAFRHASREKQYALQQWQSVDIC